MSLIEAARELLQEVQRGDNSKPRDTKQPRDPQPVVVRLSDVEPEEVFWLWEPYIPLGKLTFLEGDPGIGKTWLALQLAAIISRGDPFPGPDGVPRERREPGNVVYLTAEDGLADTLRPRLDKAGADTKRVFALTGYEEYDEETGNSQTRAVTLKSLEVIEGVLIGIRPVLLVVDPLQAYLGAGVDMHRANEVRPVLAGLAALAERHKCAVLCIRHLGKSQQDRVIYRGLGSIDFAAAARSILLVGEHPEKKRRRVLAQAKSSLAAQGPSIEFEITDDGFYWCGVSDISPEQLVSAPRTEEERSAVDEAVEFIQEALSDGPRPADDVLKEARKAGIAEKTLNRAKTKLGIKVRRIGITGKRGGGTWFWYLDGQDDFLNKTDIRTNVGHLNQNLRTLDTPSFPEIDLDGHVTILKKSPENPNSQGFRGLDLDGQNEPLGKSYLDCYFGNLNEGLWERLLDNVQSEVRELLEFAKACGAKLVYSPNGWRIDAEGVLGNDYHSWLEALKPYNDNLQAALALLPAPGAEAVDI